MSYRYEIEEETKAISIFDASGTKLAELFHSDDFTDDKIDAAELVDHLTTPQPGDDGYRASQAEFGYMAADEEEGVAVEGITPVNIEASDGEVIAMVTNFEDALRLIHLLNRTLS